MHYFWIYRISIHLYPSNLHQIAPRFIEYRAGTVSPHGADECDAYRKAASMKSCFQQTLYLVLGALAIGVLVFALLSTGVLTLEAGSTASKVFFTTAAAISALGGLALACRALRCDCSPALICAWLCSARCAGVGALGGVLTALAASLVASSAVLVNVGAALCLFFLTLLLGSTVCFLQQEAAAYCCNQSCCNPNCCNQNGF